VQPRTAGKVRSAETWGDSWGANSSYGFGYSGLTFMTWLDVNGSDVATETYKGIDVHSAGSWFEAGVDSYATVFGTDVRAPRPSAARVARGRGRLVEDVSLDMS
jgi:hypothetical protein